MIRYVAILGLLAAGLAGRAAAATDCGVAGLTCVSPQWVTVVDTDNCSLHLPDKDYYLQPTKTIKETCDQGFCDTRSYDIGSCTPDAYGAGCDVSTNPTNVHNCCSGSSTVGCGVA